jgi:subtilisin family serine protease
MFNPTRANAETSTVTNSEPNDSFTPTVWKPAWIDQNNNSVADSLDQEINDRIAKGTAQDYVNVTVMLNTAPTTQDAAYFASSGGYLTTPAWTEATYGFGGMIPYSSITLFTQQCSNVLLVEKEAVGKATVAYATQQVGARTYVWNTLGLQGDPNASTSIIDTGIDASHADFSPGYGNRDFSKKIVGWTDQVGSTTSPIDDNGHGSHVAGLTAGDGFFSVDASGYATATWGTALPLSGGAATWFGGGMMVNKTGMITINVKWARTGTARLSSLALLYGDKDLSTGSWTQVASVSTPNQNTFYSLTYNVASTPSGGYDMYHIMLPATGTGNLYVTYTVSWPYMSPSDGFSAWTGVAPQSKLVGVKIIDSTGSGTTTDLLSGINWIISNRIAYHITVASMSIGFGDEEPLVNSALLNLVNSGVTVVVSAGNDGSGDNYVYSPGSVDEVITVAAMNQFDSITSYSSQGGTSRYTGSTIKPDITAPGGSHYAVPLFSADSNYKDADGWFTDIQTNDSAPMQGTSMSAPVISGCAQIVIQAMGGYAKWNWTRNQALQPKMLLLMTATETYPKLREDEASFTSPTLNRGGKDVHEGYGRVNLDAAVDAVLSSFTVGSVVTATLGMPPTLVDISVLGQRLAWARNVQLAASSKYSFSLNVPTGADYDLYLYNSAGTAYGEPVIAAKSINATTGGIEQFWVTAPYTGTYYLVVKRATETTGSGAFTLSSQGGATVTVTLNTPGLPSAANVVHYVQGGISKTGNIVANTFSDYVDVGTTLEIDNPIYVSATQRYTTTDPASFIVQSSGTFTVTYKTQYYIAVGSTHGVPTASQWIDQGSSFTASVTSPTETVIGDHQWVCTGYSLDGGSANSGISYTFSNVQATHTLVFNWKQQFWIQVNSAHGAPTASAWVDQGGDFTASVNSPTEITANTSQWICTGYRIDVDSLTAGTAYTFSSVATAHGIDFSWKRQFYLTVASAYGSSIGSGWYDAEATANAVLPAGTISSGNGVQRVFIGWSDDASGTGLTSNGIVMNEAKTATANWKTQYYLTTSTAYGVAGGAGWYDSGTTATAVLSVGTVSGETGVQYVFTEWGDDASGTGLTSNGIVMNGAKTATANWHTQYYLTTSTAYGAVNGAGWYDSGASAVATVSPSTVTETADTQYTFSSWGGDASGTTSSSEAITMTSPKTVTANWKTQYHLAVSTNFGSVSPSNGWYDAGSEVNISATAPSTSEGERYVWNGWAGTGAGNYTGTGTSVQVTMNSAVTEVASWTHQYMLTVNSPYSAPTPATNWFDAGTSITASVDSLVAGPIVIQYSCTGWTGTGSVPESGAAASMQFTIEQPSSITWNWETQYLLVPLIVIIIVPVAVCAGVAAYMLLRRRHKGAV